MGNAGRVLLALALVGIAAAVLRWVAHRRTAGRPPAHPRGAGAGRRTTDEPWTVLDYTAPGTPAGVQRAVVAHLGLPTRAPSAFDPVTFLQADNPGGVVVVHGTAGRALFTGGATFGPTADSGTSGSWAVRRWATRDGADCPEDVVVAMVAVRTAIADALRTVGGTVHVRVLDTAERRGR